MHQSFVFCRRGLLPRDMKVLSVLVRFVWHLDRLRKNDSISVSVNTGMLLQQKLLFVRLSGVPPIGPTIWLDFHPLDFAKFCALGMGNVQPSGEQFSLPEPVIFLGLHQYGL